MANDLAQHHNNRILDLEHDLKDIIAIRNKLMSVSIYPISKERMLAFRYHLKYNELCKSRQYLGWPEPREEPAWVRKHTWDSIVNYIISGG